jgi:hypothetical protein
MLSIHLLTDLDVGNIYTRSGCKTFNLNSLKVLDLHLNISQSVM